MCFYLAGFEEGYFCNKKKRMRKIFHNVIESYRKDYESKILHFRILPEDLKFSRKKEVKTMRTAHAILMPKTRPFAVIMSEH